MRNINQDENYINELTDSELITVIRTSYNGSRPWENVEMMRIHHSCFGRNPLDAHDMKTLCCLAACEVADRLERKQLMW